MKSYTKLSHRFQSVNNEGVIATSAMVYVRQLQQPFRRSLDVSYIVRVLTREISHHSCTRTCGDSFGSLSYCLAPPMLPTLLLMVDWELLQK
jgi:hypothetical protein